MTEVAIIGGGPAGLAAANALHSAGIGFQLFDIGLPLSLRKHDEADQLGIGIGGAGLFSDGKFSYYPSGTNLYKLSDEVRLAAAFDATAEALSHVEIEAPPFPMINELPDVGDPQFRQKMYPSQYGTLEQRLGLVANMSAGFSTDAIGHRSRVRRVQKSEDKYIVDFEHMDTLRCDRRTFSHIVIASGRFSGLNNTSVFGNTVPLDEQRYEVGIRIEHPNGRGFFKDSTSPDIKLILRDLGVEVRTFCTCRSGEVWQIPYDGISALSGRSDGPPSGYSNFGLLPRFTDDRRVMGRDIWRHFICNHADRGFATWQPLPEFLGMTSMPQETAFLNRPWFPQNKFVRGNVAELLSPNLHGILTSSLNSLVERYPDLLSDETVCMFPAVEGAGMFPAAGNDLKVSGENIWCCGDAVGRFRGLIPAMVSGYYVGRAIYEDLTDTII